MRPLLIEDEKEMADALSTTLGKQGGVIDHTMRLENRSIASRRKARGRDLASAPSQIVANHNGRIVLESTPFGSTFRVRF